MLTSELWQITIFSLVSAAAATLMMLPLGVGLAWALARREFWGKAVLETVITVPLVLPPVATGLILLKLFGPRGPLGRALGGAEIDVVFTWKAVILAMSVMGLPLLVRAVRVGFEQVSRRYEEIAATLGAAPGRIFLTISLPLAGRAVLAGALLGFARALGEFGATIMVAGSIPGETRTLSVAIFTLTETGRDREAAVLLMISLLIAFVAIAVANRLGGNVRST